MIALVRLERGAQTTNVHVDGTGTNPALALPDVLEQLLTIEYSTRVLYEETDQAILDRRQAQLIRADGNLMRRIVQRDRPDFQCAVQWLNAGALQYHIDAGRQFRRLTRLRDAIVDAATERLGERRRRREVRYHQDACGLAVRRPLDHLCQIDTGHVTELPLRDDEGTRRFFDCGDGGDAVAHHGYFVAGSTEFRTDPGAILEIGVCYNDIHECGWFIDSCDWSIKNGEDCSSLTNMFRIYYILQGGIPRDGLRYRPALWADPA